jgi:hypothetical protein
MAFSWEKKYLISTILVLFMAGCSSAIKIENESGLKAGEARWVEKTIKSMSLEEKLVNWWLPATMVIFTI